MSFTITVSGDKRPARLLHQGQVPREFRTEEEAEREAKRLNVVAEAKGVPWRYALTRPSP